MAKSRESESPEEAEARKAKRREYYRKNKKKLNAAVKAYYWRNREKVLADNRRSHLKHRDARLARDRERYYQNHEAEKKERRDSRAKHRETILARERDKRRSLRVQAFDAYGGARCKCCGETHIEFLGIDHIDGGGNRHRKTISKYFYKWLKDNNYPSGFRVLCHNCNMARAFYGICPHEAKRAHAPSEPEK